MPKIIVSRARTRELLKEGPVLAKDLVAEFDCEYHLAWSLLRRMHIKQEVHIGGWMIPATGRAVPIYYDGPGDDVARPETLTNLERVRRHQARKQWGTTAEAIDKQLARRKALLQDNYDLQMAEIARSLNVINARKAQYDDSFNAAVETLADSAAAAKRALVRPTVPKVKGVKAPAPKAPTAKLFATPPAAALSLLGQLQGAQS